MFGAPRRIGLEVGAQTLKVAWCSGRAEDPRAWGYREQPRAGERTPESLCEELARLLRPLRRGRLRARVVVAAPQSFVHRLSLQVPDLRQVHDAVQERLPGLLPFDPEDAYVQYRVQRQQRVDDRLECRLSVAVCERSALDPVLDALWQAGWIPSEVVPSSLALLHAAGASQSLGATPALLIDLGTHRTTIAMADDSRVVYARDVALGCAHLTEALMGRVVVGEEPISLTREQAEALLGQAGIPAGGGAQEAVSPEHGLPRIPMAVYLALLQPVLEQLLSEIQRTVTMGAQAPMSALPQQAVLSGEGGCLPHADRWLSEGLNLPVVRLSGERFVGAEGESAALACGLVVSDRPQPLNLQPGVYRRRWRLTRAASAVWKALALASALFWCGAGWWWTRHHGVTRELRALQARWERVQPVVSLQQSIEAHAPLARWLDDARGISPAWFRGLALDFPDPVRLTQLSIASTRHITMAGEAQERDQVPEAYVSELTFWLEREKICQQVQLGSSRRADPSGSLVQFALACQWPAPKATGER